VVVLAKTNSDSPFRPRIASTDNSPIPRPD
jgi:hypothetical protein